MYGGQLFSKGIDKHIKKNTGTDSISSTPSFVINGELFQNDLTMNLKK